MWAAHRSAQSLRIGIFRPAACEPGHRPPPLHRAARRAARFGFRTLGADANAPYTRSPRIDEGARSDHALQALAAVRCDEQITARQIPTSASTARRDPPCLLLPHTPCPDLGNKPEPATDSLSWQADAELHRRFLSIVCIGSDHGKVPMSSDAADQKCKTCVKLTIPNN